MRRIALALVAPLAAVAFAVPAQGEAADDEVIFLTADRTVECLVLDAGTTVGSVDCVYAKVLAGPSTPVTHDLFVHAHRHWLVRYSGPALVGSTRRGLGHAPVRVLPAGGTLTLGHFSCSSRAAGLTCASRHSGHGFFLSAARQRTF